jgi:3-phytase
MRKYALFLLALLLIASAALAQENPEIAQIPALAETDPIPNDGAVAPLIWLHPTDLAQSAIIATDDDGGLAVYDLEGAELHYYEIGEAKYIDARYNFMLSDEAVSLIGVANQETENIEFFSIDPDTRELTEAGIIETELELNALCLYVSQNTGRYYAFGISEEGNAQQWVLDGSSGEVSGSVAREFFVGSETEGCTVDDELGALYIAEEEVAIWRYGAEPTAATERRVVDIVKGSIGGNIEGEVEGLTLYLGANERGYLIASNQTANNYLVYDRKTNELVGTFEVVDGEGVDSIQEPAGLDVVNLPLNDTFPQGLFVGTDELNTDPTENTNFKLVSWSDIAESLNLVEDVTADPRLSGSTEALTSLVAQVEWTVETAPVPSGADSADDPAIWIHPTDPNLSTIIGTDKSGGLAVYDLSGEELQYLPDGNLNNVDLRYNFPLGDESVAVVAASNRTLDSISVYTIDPETRLLSNAEARILNTEMTRVYGFCMYHSAVTGKYYAIINSEDGIVEQWELFDDGNGKIDATLARTLSVGSQTEGCVADDELGHLYIGEEAVGVWKYGAEPNAGDERVQVDFAGEGGNLVIDVEGMSIYYAAEGEGYLVVSSQGSSEFVLYERAGDNAYVGRYQVSGDDVVTGTDGLDVTNFALGDAFPEGVFVTQDDENTNPASNQNYKFVPWNAIAAALDLTVDTSHDPRTVGAE